MLTVLHGVPSLSLSTRRSTFPPSDPANSRSPAQPKLPIITFALFLLASFLPGLAQARDPTTSILFIGNSLTYSNDLPSMVKEIAAAEGRRVRVESVAFPNFSLADHLADGRAVRALRSREWDWVVLQQGPSAAPSSRSELLASVASFRKESGKGKTRIAMLSVWPSTARLSDFDRVSESYRLAAESVGGVWIPAGEVWREAWRRDPKIPFHGSDGFHPSIAGSFAAALAVYAELFSGDRPLEKRTRDIPRNINLSSGQIDLLFDVAGKRPKLER